MFGVPTHSAGQAFAMASIASIPVTATVLVLAAALCHPVFASSSDEAQLGASTAEQVATSTIDPKCPKPVRKRKPNSAQPFEQLPVPSASVPSMSCSSTSSAMPVDTASAVRGLWFLESIRQRHNFYVAWCPSRCNSWLNRLALRHDSIRALQTLPRSFARCIAGATA